MIPSAKPFLDQGKLQGNQWSLQEFTAPDQKTDFYITQCKRADILSFSHFGLCKDEINKIPHVNLQALDALVGRFCYFWTKSG